MINIISAGHQQGGGAFGLFSETVENRKVVQAIKNIDGSFLDTTINYSIDANNELIEKVKNVNYLCANNEVYCYSDIHFNASASHEGKGVECVILGYESGLYASKQSYQENYEKARKVCESISKATGLVNRGVKTNNDFYVLRKSNCHSMIIEICFLDNAADVKKYNSNVVAAAIVKGLGGNITNIKEDIKVKNIVVFGNDIDKRGAEYLADKLQCSTISKNTNYDYSNIENIYCVGGNQSDFTSYCTKFIAGSNRYETCQNVLNFIKTL